MHTTSGIHRFFALIFIVSGLTVATAQAQSIPLMIPFSGNVDVGGTPFNGNGQFKFAITNGDPECANSPSPPCEVFWLSSADIGADGEPDNATTIPVTNGLFSIKLGDTNLTDMDALPTTVFASNATTFLRVWFSDDGASFEQLTPDRQLLSVPYAYRAEIANSTSGSGSTASAGTVSLSGSITSTTVATLDSFSATIPGPGVLLLQVSGQWWFNLDAGSANAVTSSFNMGLCDTLDSQAECDGTFSSYFYQDADDVDTNNSTHGFTITRIVPVAAAGTQTFYLNVSSPTGQPVAIWGSTNASVVFVPAALTVTSP